MLKSTNSSSKTTPTLRISPSLITTIPSLMNMIRKKLNGLESFKLSMMQYTQKNIPPKALKNLTAQIKNSKTPLFLFPGLIHKNSRKSLPKISVLMEFTNSAFIKTAKFKTSWLTITSQSLTKFQCSQAQFEENKSTQCFLKKPSPNFMETMNLYPPIVKPWWKPSFVEPSERKTSLLLKPDNKSSAF